MKIIELENVNLKYQQKDLILENVNLAIDEGQMVAIIGPSGSGKSTLFKSLVRNLKPTTGTIKLFGKDIFNEPKKEWKQTINQIGFLTQKPNLINTDNVFNNVKRSISQYQNWFFKFFSLLTKKQKINIFQTLDELDILDKAFYRVSDLSGGQQQRVEITKLLIKEAKIILADEPTSNLDIETANEVLSILKNLNRKNKITILVNIHDIDLAFKYFEKIIIIKDKKVIDLGKTEELDKCKIIEMMKK